MVQDEHRSNHDPRFQYFLGKTAEKHEKPVRIAGLQAKIQTTDPLNMTQAC
jgi:hypothetical protein